MFGNLIVSPIILSFHRSRLCNRNVHRGWKNEYIYVVSIPFEQFSECNSIFCGRIPLSPFLFILIMSALFKLHTLHWTVLDWTGLGISRWWRDYDTLFFLFPFHSSKSTKKKINSKMEKYNLKREITTKFNNFFLFFFRTIFSVTIMTMTTTTTTYQNRKIKWNETKRKNIF